MKCPHCGKPISVGVMCADCADAISTNEIFEMFTIGGRLSDSTVGLIAALFPVVGVLVLIGMVASLILVI